MDSFVYADDNPARPEDSVHERRNWKIEDYISIYFEDSEFENICKCTNIRYLEDKERL